MAGDRERGASPEGQLRSSSPIHGWEKQPGYARSCQVGATPGKSGLDPQILQEERGQSRELRPSPCAASEREAAPKSPLNKGQLCLGALQSDCIPKNPEAASDI